MDITATRQPLAEIEADWLIVGLGENSDLSPPLQALDKALSGQLTVLRERGDLTGKLGEVVLDPHVPELAAQRLCLLGLGRPENFSRDTVAKSFGAAAMAVSKKPSTSIAVAIPEHTGSQMESGEIAEAVTIAMMLGCVGPGLYQAEPPRHAFDSVTLALSDKGDETQIQSAADHGKIIGESINLTRELVNRTAGDIYPETFAARVQQVATDVGLECDILDQSRLEQERMGSLLAVAQGSDRPPRMAVLHHRGGGDKGPTIALVGKGVTFDSGGLSLKTSDGMKTMKCDMAGAATVLGTMSAIARLKLPVNVIGLMGLVENMVSGSSYKLGDVLMARNGVTIEVLNTDAEGRLVLADVLSYAVDQGADRMIDLATLTGACVIALGEDYVGAFTNNQDWCNEVITATKSAGELVWQMPMDDAFDEQLKSEVADCKNVGKRWGGAITAAKFLQKFVGDTPWVHLDIAGPAFADSGNSIRDSGATGVMVRSLVELLASTDDP